MPRKLSMDRDELRVYIGEWAGKKTLYEMHIETGINQNTIANYASDMGLSMEVDAKVQKRNKLIQTINDFNHLYTAKEISALLQVPLPTVRYRAWVMRVSLKKDHGDLVPATPSKIKLSYFNPHMHENWLI